MTVNGELNFYFFIYSSFPFRLHVWLALESGVRSPKEEASLNEKETCHSATSVSVKCLGHYSEIRFCSHTSGDFYFHWHAGVKPVFGLQRLLSYIDPVSSFCPLPPTPSHHVCVTRPLDELWGGNASSTQPQNLNKTRPFFSLSDYYIRGVKMTRRFVY